MEYKLMTKDVILWFKPNRNRTQRLTIEEQTNGKHGIVCSWQANQCDAWCVSRRDSQLTADIQTFILVLDFYFCHWLKI